VKAFLESEIVVEDAPMVESQPPAAVAGIEKNGLAGVIAASGIARGPGHEDRRDGVEAWIARGVRIAAELRDQLDVERRFLAGLPDGGRLEAFAVVHEAPGEGPAGGRIPPLDENDAAASAPVHDLDDDIDGREGVARRAAGHNADRPFGSIVGAAAVGCQSDTRTSPFSG
jgi:hypothetical protein